MLRNDFSEGSSCASSQTEVNDSLETRAHDSSALMT